MWTMPRLVLNWSDHDPCRRTVRLGFTSLTFRRLMLMLTKHTPISCWPLLKGKWTDLVWMEQEEQTGHFQAAKISKQVKIWSENGQSVAFSALWKTSKLIKTPTDGFIPELIFFPFSRALIERRKREERKQSEKGPDLGRVAWATQTGLNLGLHQGPVAWATQPGPDLGLLHPQPA